MATDGTLWTIQSTNTLLRSNNMKCQHFKGLKKYRTANNYRCRNCKYYAPSLEYRNTNYCSKGNK